MSNPNSMDRFKKMGAHPRCLACFGAGVIGTPGKPCPYCCIYHMSDEMKKHQSEKSEAPPNLKVRLPIITDELREEFSGEMKLMDETGWTQNAVDFACLLQGTQTFVLSAPPQTVALSDSEERVAAAKAYYAQGNLVHYEGSFVSGWMARARLGKERK